MSSESPYFLGFDSSTQSLKATIVDDALNVVLSAAVNFDADLPAFKTAGGVHRHADGVTVTSPATLWVAALDLLLERLKAQGAPFARVQAISGSGQQHGSVWLNASAAAALRGLDPARSLSEQLGGIYSRVDSPVWMDSSTGTQCAALERALGGAERVALLTGSRAYERFTGNQIAKIQQLEPAVYARTARIALVSSFVAALCRGDLAPIDVSDGSGMNLMDIRRREWAPEALAATAPDLAARLGAPVLSHTDLGPVHVYFMKRFGFPATCRVIAFSGDNPCSLAGLRLSEPGDLAISLGTSDTLFGTLREPKPSAEEGHIFASPVDPHGYMAMICRKNGSLAREHVRDAAAGGDWHAFSGLLKQTLPGNGGRLAIHVLAPEITPPITRTGIYRFDGEGRPVDAFTPAQEVRALLEGQFLSMRLHAAAVGLRPTRLIATGGASVDRGLLRVVADVFGAPVFLADQSDSASLGAAYRALHGWQCWTAGRVLPFASVFMKAAPFKKAVDPDAGAFAMVENMLPRLAELELACIRHA